MHKLLAGLHHFQDHIFAQHQELFKRLKTGQHPRALFITCSDSRIDPSLITQTEPGELFILRNAGNIVPPYGAGHGGEAATIEYAVSVLKVKHVIVCGHSHCGAMAGLLQPDSLQGLPAVSAWLAHAETTKRIIQENYTHLQELKDQLPTTVQENVLVQLEHLRTHPSVAAALSRHDLNLHGWIYEFESGRVMAYHPGKHAFVDTHQISDELEPSDQTAAS